MTEKRKAKYGDRCECCGSTKRLQLHHTHQDGDNEHVQVLCFNCHRFWHRIHQVNNVRTFTPMPRVFREIVNERKQLCV